MANLHGGIAFGIFKEDGIYGIGIEMEIGPVGTPVYD
jgi:hypothetical protein